MKYIHCALIVFIILCLTLSGCAGRADNLVSGTPDVDNTVSVPVTTPVPTEADETTPVSETAENTEAEMSFTFTVISLR